MLVPLAILGFLIVLNGVLAMSELAVMTSRQSRLARDAKAGSKGAAAAIALAREPTRFLSTVQVGITLIGIMAGAFGENALSGKLEKMVAQVGLMEPYADVIALGVVVLGITYLSLVVGELVPKRVALAYPERVATLIARPLSVLSTVTAWPVRILTWSTEAVLRVLRLKVRAGDDVSEDDVKALIARGASTGIFTPQELTLFQRTMRVADLTVRDLMVARADIVWIDERETTDAVRVLVGTSPYSHFPVCAGDLDKLVGVVHVRDLIAYGLLSGSSFKVTSVVRQPLFVPETMPALRMLDQFQSSKVHIAFVVNEYGSTLGLVTLNDVTRAIVGDISRSGEVAPTMIKRPDGSWLIDGRLPLHEFVVASAVPPEAEAELPDVSTVGGLVVALLGHIPAESESVAWQGWTLEVIDMDGTRVDKVLATFVPPKSEDSPPADAA
ncbi:MAG: hemolysin family protein [Planctomycetota bacterium]|nr:hemolysin family protein [Planctomycetota bacterium]